MSASETLRADELESTFNLSILQVDRDRSVSVGREESSSEDSCYRSENIESEKTIVINESELVGGKEPQVSCRKSKSEINEDDSA